MKEYTPNEFADAIELFLKENFPKEKRIEAHVAACMGVINERLNEIVNEIIKLKNK